MKTVAIAFASLVASTAFAQEQTKFTCTSGKATRTIEVVYEQPGKPVPCKVAYTKEDNSSKDLFNAKGEAGYCETKAKAFAEKLNGLGWKCEPAGAAPAGEPAKNP